MIEVISKTFKSGNSEAVRLPKTVAFGADVEVIIRRDGDVLTISPKENPRKSLAQMVERLREIGPPSDGIQDRVRILAPKRDGL